MSEQKSGLYQTPSIGRMVHFVYGDRHIPAVITDPAFSLGPDAPDVQALTVFPVGESPFTTTATIDPEGGAATWHWPEFVPASA